MTPEQRLTEPMITPTPDCHVCGSARQIRIGELPLYIPGGQAPGDLLRCPDCGTWARSVDFDDPQIRAHFNVTSYTVPEREEIMRAARIDFFRSIIELATRHVSVPLSRIRALDVGVAYGHLLELYREAGARCAAVETVDLWRNRLIERGYEAYKSAREIPVDASYDIITTIDSFYYFEQPGDLLRELRPHLKSDGVLIFRLTNRTPVFRLMRLFGKPVTNDIFGDVKHSFTFHSICLLLEKTGYRIERVVLREKGKKISPLSKWLYYKLSLVASRITGIKLTPGITLVCRRNQAAE